MYKPKGLSHRPLEEKYLGSLIFKAPYDTGKNVTLCSNTQWKNSLNCWKPMKFFSLQRNLKR